MKYRYVQNSFTSGELHPRLDGRTDLEEYAKGVDTLENFITFRQGGVSRRMGSRYIANLSPMASSSYVGLVPFIFSKKEAYNITIEAKTVSTTGDTLRFKVFNSAGVVVNITTTLDDPGSYDEYKDITISGGSALGRGLENLTTEINNFVYTQSADTLFLTHNTGRIKPLVIVRTASDKFYISNIEDYFWTTDAKKSLYTPYRDANTDSGKHLDVDGSGSAVTLSMKTTSSTSGEEDVPFFSADVTNGHHGAYFIITDGGTTDQCYKINTSGIPAVFTCSPSSNEMSSTAHGLNTGDIITLSGTIPSSLSSGVDYYVVKVDADNIKLASSLANARTPTTLTFGAETGTIVSPKFVSTVVSTNINSTLGEDYRTDDWHESSFNNYRGFPRTISIFEQRLIYGGTILNPDTLYGSMTGNFFHFLEQRASTHSYGSAIGYTGNSVSTDPFQFTIASQEVNEITWLAPHTHLEVGTLGTEYIVTGGENAISATTPPFIKSQTSHGGSPIPIRKVDQSTIFVSRDGKRLREFKYNNDNGSYISRSLSISAEHIVSHLFDGDSSDASAGIEIAQFVYQSSSGILWCLTSRSALIGLTLDNDTGTIAWHKHVIGGSATKVHSICVIPNTSGTHDDLYLSLSRNIDGETKHYLEKMGEEFSHTKLKNESTSADDQAWFSDSSKRVQMSSLTKVFTSVSSDAVTINGHGLGTGTKVQVTTDDALPTGLSGSSYYLIRVDENTLKFSDTVKNAFDHISISVSGGTGNHTITPIEAYLVPGFSHLEKQSVEVLSNGFYDQDGYMPEALQILYSNVNTTDNKFNLVYVGDSSVVVPHYLTTGSAIYYKSHSTADIGGTSADTTYYVIRLDDDYFSLAATYEDAISENVLPLSSVGASGHYSFHLINAPTLVEDGFIRLKDPSKEVIAGLKYTSKLKTMKLEAGAQFGTSQGSLKRNDSIVLRFQGTYGGKFGIATNEDNLEEIVFRPAGHGMGSDLELFTGDKFLDFPGDYERFFQVVVEQDKPFPMNLLAIVHRGQTYD